MGDVPWWRRRTAIVSIAAVAMLAGFVYLERTMFRPAPEDVVTASGRIEAREVTLAPKEIQGRVTRLLVDEGDTVRKGQLVAELSSDQLDARYGALEAALANVNVQIAQASIDVAYATDNSAASIAAAEAAVSAARARVDKAKAVLADATLDRDRATSLFDGGAISKSTLDQSVMTYETSVADVDANAKSLAQSIADLATAQASKHTIALKNQQVRALQESRRVAQAQLAAAKADLDERRIVAPIDGTILSRPVEVGDVVSPGTPIFVMVDMKRLYLKVYIPEPQIPKLKLGEAASISVDAFPGRTFPARITKISEQAEFTPKNVETVEERVTLVFGVELTLLESDGVIKPGMPADCVIRANEPVVPDHP